MTLGEAEWLELRLEVDGLGCRWDDNNNNNYIIIINQNNMNMYYILYVFKNCLLDNTVSRNSQLHLKRLCAKFLCDYGMFCIFLMSDYCVSGKKTTTETISV